MLSKKIRAYKEAHPKAKAKEIAEAVGCKPAYVYQVLHIKLEKDAVPTQGHQVLRTELIGLNKMLENAHVRIKNLEHQAIGYRSVISYLEGKIDVSTV